MKEHFSTHVGVYLGFKGGGYNSNRNVVALSILLSPCIPTSDTDKHRAAKQSIPSARTNSRRATLLFTIQ